MFYFDDFYGNKILKSDFLSNINAFFTTRAFNIDSLRKMEGVLRVVTPVQIHSDHIEITDKRSEYPNTDGLILTTPETLIYLRYADCTPLIFYDKLNKVGAVSHAGWRGTAARIGVKTVETMRNIFGTKPKDVVALIGPAIGMCCYEVSDDVKEELLKTVRDKSDLSEGRCVDLKKINSRQLEEIGVKNIDICPYCTSCDNDLFYSYRRENGTKERHYAVLKLS